MMDGRRSKICEGHRMYVYRDINVLMCCLLFFFCGCIGYGYVSSDGYARMMSVVDTDFLIKQEKHDHHFGRNIRNLQRNTLEFILLS